jgi:hypothetical protein
MDLILPFVASLTHEFTVRAASADWPKSIIWMLAL